LPTVAIVEGVKVQFFFNDHPPPHFHVEYAGERAQVLLDGLTLLHGAIPIAKLQRVRDWAQTRQAELQECWDRASRSDSPGRVE
jgi:Domain of unknown function (DUF4160)